MSKRPQRRPSLLGISTLVAAGCAALALALPAPFVAESPGPTFNTIGDVEGKPLISISGHETFPTSGDLDMTTVYVSGGPSGSLNVFDALGAFADPERAIAPAATQYPPQITRDQLREANSAEMTSSQEEAIAAALRHQDIPFETQLKVAGVVDGSPAAGKINDGDVIEKINGEPVDDMQMLRAAIAEADGGPVKLLVRADETDREVSITPARGENGAWQIGVQIQVDHTFPFQIQIALDNVGGPSAGMMFALGIIDRLTPGDITGGRHFAGTGTIDSAGNVGPIGGIAQKMVGAKDAGADVFLAPAENCAAVRGNIPEGLNVVRVATLDEAVNAVEQVAAGRGVEGLPTCG